MFKFMLMRLFSSWKKHPKSKKSPARWRSPRPTVRLCLEQLEDRTMPSAVMWTGGGGDFNWDNAANWSTNALPGTSDDVTISQTGITITHAANVSESIKSLSSQANIDWQSGSLTLAVGGIVSGMFNDAGVVTLQSGNLALDGPVTSTGTGTFTGASGTNLTFWGNTTFATGSRLDSGGDVTFYGGTDSVQGTYNVAGTGRTILGFGAQVDFSGTVLGVGSTLNDGGGTADFHNTALNLSNLYLNGGLLRAGDITVTHQFGWSASTVAGPGTHLTIGSSATLVMDNGTGTGGAFWFLDGRNLDNYGTVDMGADPPARSLTLSHGAIVNNYGTFQAISGNTRSVYGSGTGEAFHNYGMLIQSGVGRLVVGVAFDNAGSVDVRGGTFEADGPTTNAGSITTASGTTLYLNGRLNEQIRGASPVTGYGQIISNGTVNLSAGLSVTVVDPFSPTLGQVFRIIDNTGTNGASGKFSGLAEGASVTDNRGNQYSISYVGGNGNDVVLTTTFVSNRPPTAIAGGPYAVTYGGSVSLDASRSSDPDNDPLTYSWTVNGHAAAATGVQPTLTWSSLAAMGIVSGQSYAVTVTADDGHGHAVTSAATTLTVNKATSTTTTVGAGPFIYNGSAQVGGSGTVTGSGGLSVSASSLTYSANSDGTGVADQTDAGTYYVTAHYIGDANHTASNGAAVAITINKADQAISTNWPTRAVGANSVTLSLTSSSGLAVSYTVGGPATLDPSTHVLTITALGTVTVTARQAGNSNYNKASDISTSYTVAPASLCGILFKDFNKDGFQDYGELGVAGVTVQLTGTDFNGSAVSQSATTGASGYFQFANLLPGTYAVSIPGGLTVTKVTVGLNGSNPAIVGSGLSAAGLAIAEGTTLNVVNFGLEPAAGDALSRGQTAGIGFWNNKNGQALIKSLDGGTGSELGGWLAATFQNMFGSQGHDLTGSTNAQVAAYFQTLFATKGDKLEAQVLATALSVYVTNSTLAGGNYASAYGFTVVANGGTGLATFNVGTDGAAIGQANGTTLTIMDILLAIDRHATRTATAVGFELYSGDQAMRGLANDLFGKINDLGGI